VRSLRIIGIFLSTVAVFLAFNWFLNTLMPLNRLNGLQPIKAEVLAQRPAGTIGLLECYMSPNWTTGSSSLLLDCGGSEIRVQQSPSDIKNLAAKVTAPGEKKVLAVSDPVVVVGKMSSNNLGNSLGKDSNAIDAELVAYGRRSTNLAIFQASGVLQIIGAEIIGLFAILFLFIDWRVSRSRQSKRTREAWQAEKSYAASKRVEKSAYQPKR
jgi:hypothetical protein